MLPAPLVTVTLRSFVGLLSSELLPPSNYLDSDPSSFGVEKYQTDGFAKLWASSFFCGVVGAKADVGFARARFCSDHLSALRPVCAPHLSHILLLLTSLFPGEDVRSYRFEYMR